MPSCSPDARTNKSRNASLTGGSTPLDSPALSLPNPLSEAEQSPVFLHLIDFEDHQLPACFYHPRSYTESSAGSSTGDCNDVVCHSPPFIEAHLPREDPEDQVPLPVPPRILEGDPAEGLHATAIPGHVRSPMLQRLPTSGTSPPPRSVARSISPSGTLESLSKTVRTYSPLPIASATPYPPLVSRPVSFGVIANPPTSPDAHSACHQEYGPEYQDAESGYGYGSSKAQPPPPGIPMIPGPSYTPSTAARSRPSSTSSPSYPNPVPDRQRAWEVPQHEADAPHTHGSIGGYTSRPQRRSTRSQGSSSSALTQTLRRGSSPLRKGGVGGYGLVREEKERVEYPSARSEYGHGHGDNNVDRVVWARWDRLGNRPLLILGYAVGLQIWDAGNLAYVTEVLNLNMASGEWSEAGPATTTAVVKAGVIPRGNEPLLAVLLESQALSSSVQATLAIYSLGRDRVVERRTFLGTPQTFECSGTYLIISTSSPVALHIMSTISFKTLFTIPASALATFAITPTMGTTRSAHLQQQHLQVPSYLSTAYSLNRPVSSLEREDQQLQREGLEAPSRIIDRDEQPHPVFALSHRLLAYAVPSSYSSFSPPFTSTSSSPSDDNHTTTFAPTTASAATSPSSPSSETSATSALSTQSGLLSKMPTTQAQLGTAAMRVGGSVILGMRFWGGIALEAAKNRMGPVGSPPPPPPPSAHRGSAAMTTATMGGGGRSLDSRERKGGGGGADGLRKFFSRSAPSTGGVRDGGVDNDDERRFSDHHQQQQQQQQRKASISRRTTLQGRFLERGYLVVVVDLGAVTRDRVIGEGGEYQGQEKEKEEREESVNVVAEFVGSRSQPIGKLSFSPDGCSLLVVPRDGYVTKVFQLSPYVPIVPQSLVTEAKKQAGGGGASQHPYLGSAAAAAGGGTAVPLYELRRGRTTAVVEDIKVVGDGRWTGVTTRNRTVHVFPTNALGGKPHHASHLEGRVRNYADNSMQTKVELAPLVRLRGAKMTGRAEEDVVMAPLAFTFVELGETYLSTARAPHGIAADPTPSPSPTPPSTSPTTTTTWPVSSSPPQPPPLSPHHLRTASSKNYQDALLFDSVTGVLAHHRITVEQRPRESGIVSAALSGTSLSSFPGMGGGGPLSVSSSLSSNSGGKGMGVASVGRKRQPHKPVEEQYDLVGRSAVVATWDLQKKKSWEEIRMVLGGYEKDGGERAGGRGRAVVSEEFLAQAELSTCSKSRTALTRPIYISHQFSFQTLGEDYHALIRRYRLDVVDGTKIDVRKDVPIQAFYSANTSLGGGGGTPLDHVTDESFVKGFSSPPSHHHRTRVSSSFDEPLASAMAGELDYQPSAAVLPMYPNGPSTRSFRNSIPIRTMAGLGEGVSEGLGKIRREMMMHRAMRSPRLGPHTETDRYGDVLLEFDEEVDDFMAPRVIDAPAAGAIFDDEVVGAVDEEIWDGWDYQDKQAVEEAEQFHTISPAQYVDDVKSTIGGGKAVVVAKVPIVGQIAKKLSNKRK